MLEVQAVTQKSPEEKCIEPQESFLRTLAKTVAQIYTMFSEIAQNDRAEIVRLECNYKIHSFQSADLMRSLGKIGFASACLSMIVFAASMGMSNVNNQKFVQLASEKVPMLTKMFESQREGTIKSQDAISQLEYAQMQDKHNKAQSEGNAKEQFASVLQAEIQRLRSAATANG